MIADANQNIGVVKGTELHIGSTGSETQVTATAAELNYVDITTLGTAQASKAVTTDSNKDITGVRNIDIDGTANLDVVDIDAGSIDGVVIGANSASTGAFTTITASTSLDVTGSAGIILENDETITNSSNGTLLVTATTTSLSGDLTVTGNVITFGNGETISNSTDGKVVVTATTIELSGKTDFNDNAITGYGADLQTLSGTSKTLAAVDNGTVIICSSGSATTITVPIGLPAGFNCMIVQTGAGQVTLSPSSTTLNNRNGLKTAAQYAMMTLVNYTTNTFVVSGDTVN